MGKLATMAGKSHLGSEDAKSARLARSNEASHREQAELCARRWS